MIGDVAWETGHTSAGKLRFARTLAMSEATAEMVATTVSIGPVVKFVGKGSGWTITAPLARAAPESEPAR
jgi:hypothetical protein